MFQFTAAPKKGPKTAAVDVTSINPSKVMGVKALGLGFHTGWINLLTKQPRDRANFEQSPYPLDRIIEAIDTDSYIKQAFFKYKELFWKEGWEIISENDEAVSYLWQRFDLMEETMKRPFNSFLIQVVDQLFKFGNAFIVESRAGDIRPYFPGPLKSLDGKLPVVGYYIIPTETVRIYRDRFNNPIAYKQQTDETSAMASNHKDPVWDASEVIHLSLDKKEGKAFGTPFVISVLDDVIALRQIEQDIQNLVHNELFPIYQYIVGTETKPASPEEIEQAFDTIANMRVEGGLITPERHKIEVIGAQGNALEVNEYLQHFKERVAVGMGLSTHHLGMLGSGANRSVTDRLDIALYDKIKLIQSEVEDLVRLRIFNPLLREGGFDPLLTPHRDSVSDRCYMRFREIDVDTQIKRETHVIQKFSSNLTTFEEARIELGQSPDCDHKQLLMSMTAQVQTTQQEQIIKATPQQPKAMGTGADGKSKFSKPPTPEPVKPDAIKPSAGGTANQPNAKRGIGNKVRPANQHGRRMSPNVRHMDESMLNDIVELLGDEDE
jgi:hypothetical protein